MAQQNLIAVNIPETDLAEIKVAMATLKEKLLPHLQMLTPQERLELPKMGERNVSFVQKALEYGLQNNDLVPAFLDIKALAIDVKAVQTLRDIVHELSPIHDALHDSMTLSGSEAYQGALVFYSNVKNAAKVKTPKAGSIYDDLASRFPGGTSKKKV